MKIALQFTLRLLFFAVTLTGINECVDRFILPETVFFVTFIDQGFIAVTSFITLMVCAVLFYKLPKIVGFAYAGIGMLKLIGVTVYLLPELLNKSEYTVNFVIHFFILYFIYQVIEVIILVGQFKKIRFSAKNSSPV